MSVVTFWNDDREQSGKTLSAVAVATMMAIERNFKILLLSTSCNDSTMKNCFWVDSTRKNSNKDLFGRSSNNIAVENGIEGLTKLISANKIQPSIITDYTRVIFKGRLEVLNGYTGAENDTNPNEYSFQKVSELYPELIKIANQYYDMVIVDLDKNLNQKIKDLAGNNNEYQRQMIEKSYKELELEKTNKIEKLQEILNKSELEISKEKVKELKTAMEYFEEIISSEIPSRYVLENIIDTIWIYSDKTVKFDLKVDIQKLI